MITTILLAFWLTVSIAIAASYLDYPNWSYDFTRGRHFVFYPLKCLCWPAYLPYFLYQALYWMITNW